MLDYMLCDNDDTDSLLGGKMNIDIIKIDDDPGLRLLCPYLEATHKISVSFTIRDKLYDWGHYFDIKRKSIKDMISMAKKAEQLLLVGIE